MIERALATFAIGVVSIWLHELGHARAARDLRDRLGARRWTFRPFVNLDPIFSLIVPLVSSLLTGGAFIVGMGRPFLLQRPNWKIIAAGPTVNLALFFMFAAFDQWHVASINLGLFFVNMLPIRPFDGWAIISCYRMEKARRKSLQNVVTTPEAQRNVLGFTIPPDGPK